MCCRCVTQMWRWEQGLVCLLLAGRLGACLRDCRVGWRADRLAGWLAGWSAGGRAVAVAVAFTAVGPAGAEAVMG